MNPRGCLGNAASSGDSDARGAPTFRQHHSKENYSTRMVTNVDKQASGRKLVRVAELQFAL